MRKEAEQDCHKEVEHCDDVPAIVVCTVFIKFLSILSVTFLQNSELKAFISCSFVIETIAILKIVPKKGHVLDKGDIHWLPVMRILSVS